MAKLSPVSVPYLHPIFPYHSHIWVILFPYFFFGKGGEVEGGCDSIRIDPDSPESPKSQDLDTSEASDISTSDRSSDPTSVECTSQPQTTNERRNLLDAKLKGYKTEKLKRKLPAESQFLNLAQEELTIKKQLIEKNECNGQ